MLRKISVGGARRVAAVACTGTAACAPAVMSSASSVLSASPAPMFVSAVRFAATAVVPPKGDQLYSGVGGGVEDGPETHPDFQSKPVASTTDDEADIKAIKDDIVQTIKDEPVVLFIKGSPEAPVCGFSKRVVDLLDALGVEYTSFDVLAHPTVRSYVKEVSNWPTIPQLFIKGEFFGGQDIIFEQAQNGQMQMALERAGIEYRPLKINP
jgi:monothiol glutaredoxin